MKHWPHRYKDLENHGITVNIWRVSKWTFNEHFGTRTKYTEFINEKVQQQAVRPAVLEAFARLSGDVGNVS